MKRWNLYICRKDSKIYIYIC